MWKFAALVFNDEVGAASPALYATVSARAYWGKLAGGQVDDVDPAKAPFGNPLVEVDCGDFAQLPPVPRGTTSLTEALIADATNRRTERGL